MRETKTKSYVIIFMWTGPAFAWMAKMEMKEPMKLNLTKKISSDGVKMGSLDCYFHDCDHCYSAVVTTVIPVRANLTRSYLVGR